MNKKDFEKTVAEGLEAFGEEGVLDALLKAQRKWYTGIEDASELVRTHLNTKINIIKNTLQTFKDLWRDRKSVGF